MKEHKTIKEIQDKANEYWKHYEEEDERQSQGIAQGLEMAIKIIKEQNH